MRLITSIRKPCPSDCDRIVTTGPSRSSPPVQKCCAEMMSVSVAGIQKNCCRTTIPERSVRGGPAVKVYEGARGLDGAIVTVDGKPLPPRHNLQCHVEGRIRMDLRGRG